MKSLNIKVEGKSYPCRPTMGAMLRFKQETGKEITQMGVSDISEMCLFLYCCVVSACKREGVPFDYELMDFADRVDPNDVQSWGEQLNAEAEDDTETTEGGKKKTP